MYYYAEGRRVALRTAKMPAPPNPYPAPPVASSADGNLFTRLGAFLNELFGADSVSAAPLAVDAPLGEVYFLLSDHLGSTTMTLGINGSVVSQTRYGAWGNSRYTSGTSPTDRKYTGQIEEASGLYFYNARWYDSSLARFIQADTIIPQPSSSLAWDRYGYTNNNPIIFSDPDGHFPLLVTAAIGGAIGAIVGAVGYTAYTAISGTQFNAGTMLLAAGGGTVAGALIGTGVGWAAGVGAAEATTAAITGVGALEAANTVCGRDMCASEVQDASQAAQTALPAVQNATSQVVTSINTGSNVVYQFLEGGVTKYYGITNDFARRAAEHTNARGWTIQKIPGLDSLSRFDARAIEQVLIENVGLPSLYNKINSIATSNNIYPDAIQRGTFILQQVGLMPK